LDASRQRVASPNQRSLRLNAAGSISARTGWLVKFEADSTAVCVAGLSTSEWRNTQLTSHCAMVNWLPARRLQPVGLPSANVSWRT
jgi:hypothetical protein